MPRYFFDVHDGIHVIDDVGQDLDGIAAAKKVAWRRAVAYVAEPKLLERHGGNLVVVIRDDTRSVRLTMRLNFSIADEVSRPVSGEPTAAYHAVILKRDDGVDRVIPLTVENDQDAVAQATKMIGAYAIDLWDGLRFIEHFRIEDVGA